MRLKTFSDYSLRVLIYLALYHDRLVTISELAKAYNISRNHLMKIVSYMAQKGIIETIRGQGGGMRLAMPPEDILIGDVLKDTEADAAIVECFKKGPSDCLILPACSLIHHLHEAEQAFYESLNRFSLKDLITNEDQIKYYLEREE